MSLCVVVFFVVCGLLRVACCLFDASCLLFVVHRLLFVVRFSGLLFVGRGVLFLLLLFACC